MKTEKASIENEILNTLRYFNYFKYAPTFEELHTFLRPKVTTTTLHFLLKGLKKDGKIAIKSKKYTVGEYSKNIDRTVQSQIITQDKIDKIKSYLSFISRLPTVLLVGFSGSVSMNNANAPDDIDIFIITAKKRMWITRLVLVGIAELLFLRRKRGQIKAKDTVCLNMFMDESNLQVPSPKKTLYIAHEVLQLKPIFNKKKVYEKFLTANSWVFDIFPNAQKYYIQDVKTKSKSIKKHTQILKKVGNFLELLAKKFQLYFIQKHTTSEYITDTQLWFFPDDYEKKLKKKKLSL